jgi:WD40 repeat protein
MLTALGVSTALAGEPAPRLRHRATIDDARPWMFTPLVYSPDGRTLATVELGEAVLVKLWDAERRKLTATLKGHVGLVTMVAFSKDGKTVITGSTAEVKVWDAATGKELASHKCPDRAPPVALSPDGKTVAGNNTDTRTVILWDLESGREKLTIKTLPAAALSVKFSPDGKYLATAGGTFASNGQPADTDIKIWDAATGKEVKALTGEKLTVAWSVAFSPDSRTLASADVYGNVLLWDVRTGKRTATLQAFDPNGKEEDINSAYSVAFSPHGDLVAAGTVRGVKLWDVKTGKEVGGATKPMGTVWAVAFHRDGRTLATAGSQRVIGAKDQVEGDEVLRVWQWGAGKEEK